MGDAGGIKRRRGLAADQAKARAWQRDSARRYADNLRARRHAARILAGPIIRKAIRARTTNSGNDWSPATRRLAKHRSGGICERCLKDEAVHLHHRKSRRYGDHRIVNALHLCHACHRKIHSAPSWSYIRGFLVRAHRDPADVAVRLDDYTPTFLTHTGTYRKAA
jgi:hypothetical protein